MIDNKELKRLLICPYCQKGIIEQLNYFQCFSCRRKFFKKDYDSFCGDIGGVIEGKYFFCNSVYNSQNIDSVAPSRCFDKQSCDAPQGTNKRL